MRLVLDSNVLIAAFAAQGLCHSLFEICLTDHMLFVSQELLDEMEEKLRRKLKLSPKTVKEIIAYLQQHTHLETPARLESRICRDPNDDFLLGLILTVRADALVTGDKDLLVLKKFKNIPILSPRDFYTLLQAPHP